MTALADQTRPAVAHLAVDGFVAYPTETVWGLGACADRPRAVERLMDWKGRSANAPMSVLVPSVAAAERLDCTFEGPALRLAESFWPGPLTLIVPCTRDFARGIQRDDRALGLRCSPHPIARALALAVDRAGLGPLTSTSMNRSGQPPALDRTAAQALVPRRTESGDLDPAEPLLVIDPVHDAGGETPSSVVDCTGASPRVLRAGAIESERLEKVWSRAERTMTREKVR